MGTPTKWLWSGLEVVVAVGLTGVGTMPVLAAMSHDAHVTTSQDSEVATPVAAQAGPMLMDKMGKAIAQIEREVQSKGRSEERRVGKEC